MFSMDILKKKNDIKTPLILKLSIIFQLLFLIGPISKIISANNAIDFASIIAAILQIVSLIAIWNMRKWGLVAFVIISILGVAISFPEFGFRPKALIVFTVIRGTVIIPALIFWNKME
jgi:hypothetical protein